MSFLRPELTEASAQTQTDPPSTTSPSAPSRFAFQPAYSVRLPIARCPLLLKLPPKRRLVSRNSRVARSITANRGVLPSPPHWPSPKPSA